MTTEADAVPVVGDGEAVLLPGSRCRVCGEAIFPALPDCPLCLGHDAMEPASLRGHGALRDWVLTERGGAEIAAPYVQAWIELDDGPVVFTVLEAGDPRTFEGRAGDVVVLVGRRFGDGDTAVAGWVGVPGGAS